MGAEPATRGGCSPIGWRGDEAGFSPDRLGQPTNATIHGKRKLVHVKGIILPKHCPKGGWPVASQFTFEDGTSTLAKHTIPCPRR